MEVNSVFSVARIMLVTGLYCCDIVAASSGHPQIVIILAALEYEPPPPQAPPIKSTEFMLALAGYTAWIIKNQNLCIG